MERDKMDASLNLNSNQIAKKDKTEAGGSVAKNQQAELFKSEAAETAGTIASNSPSPLFTNQAETAGTIACNSSSSGSSGGSLSALG